MFSPLPFSACTSLSGTPTTISRNAVIGGLPEDLRGTLAQQVQRHGTAGGIQSIDASLSEQGNPESYRLSVTPQRIVLSAGGEQGLHYAVQTLMRLLEEPQLPCVELHNVPVCSFRALKAFLPEPTEQGFADFRRLLDFITRYHYNTLVLEIGGAMEYRRHPEINEGWLEYAAFMNEYSGKPGELFKTIPWNKNSVHATNGGGKVLTQNQIRDLLTECRKRRLTVIPEIPCLSHCDYLLTRHRDLAERPDDPYPDTACPNHPDYYPLLFDVIDEVIEVFQPHYIHLGHDEYYSIGLCPRCRNTSAPEIYARDLIRCHDYLKERKVRMIIWSEKLLNAHFLGSGEPIGGAHCKSWTAPDSGNDTPATWPAIDRIPQDILMMHWYWGIDRTLEQAYTDHHLDMVYGNASIAVIPEWSKRRQAPNFKGTCCSNWGSMDWLTMQRNALLFDLVYVAALHWNPSLDSTDFKAIRDWTLDELYHQRTQELAGCPHLEVVHTTDCLKPFKYFCDGVVVEQQKELLGWHDFRDSQGKTHRFPVYYGCNIAGDSVSMELGDLCHRLWESDHSIAPNDVYRLDWRFCEVSYATRPEVREGKLYCRCVYPLPPGCQDLIYEGFTPAEGFTGTVQLAEFQEIS